MDSVLLIFLVSVSYFFVLLFCTMLPVSLCCFILLVFVLLFCTMLPVSLCCLFSIAPSVFSNVCFVFCFFFFFLFFGGGGGGGYSDFGYCVMFRYSCSIINTSIIPSSLISVV